VERVREALLELTEEQRQVIVFKFLEGMDNTEVAEIIGKSVGAVKALQHRGLDALRAQLVTPQEPVHVGRGWEQVQIPSFG
jgi:RNA polymerase sigma-70 factor (ECF subfamily)